MDKLIKVLYFKNKEKPKYIEIKNDLSTLQEMVGGYIQAVPLKPDIFLICNETGMLDNLPYQERYNIFGDFVIAKANGDELTSLDEISAKRILKEIDNLMSRIL